MTMLVLLMLRLLIGGAGKDGVVAPIFQALRALAHAGQAVGRGALARPICAVLPDAAMTRASCVLIASPIAKTSVATGWPMTFSRGKAFAARDAYRATVSSGWIDHRHAAWLVVPEFNADDSRSAALVPSPHWPMRMAYAEPASITWPPVQWT